MTTPIDPQMCMQTGRLLTEWFENEQVTDETIKRDALDYVGVSEYPPNGRGPMATEDEKTICKDISMYIGRRNNRKWKQGMTQQEVATRMNEATKMVDPSNFKFLPDDVRERTGLEVNPLWYMECLIRSGVMSPKEMMGGLKELAAYTHSKAPTVNNNHNINTSEDWLEELAKEEYQQIEIAQPKTPAEKGAGKEYARRQRRKSEETRKLENWRNEAVEHMEADISQDDWEEI